VVEEGGHSEGEGHNEFVEGCWRMVRMGNAGRNCVAVAILSRLE